MDRRTFTQSIAVGALAAATGPAFADDDKDRWGNLTARFIYDGDWPVPKPIIIPRPFPKGIKLPKLDHSLVVDPMTKGIANIVCWLYLPPVAKDLAIHPSYDELPKEPARVAFRDYALEPRVTTCRVKQTLQMENADPIDHFLKADLFKNPAFVQPIPSGGEAKLSFERPESRPMPLHSPALVWIDGFIVIKDHPYTAVTDAQGKLTIKNLPVGEHTFTFWHEQAGYLAKVKRNGESETWKLGRVTVAIKPGDNDLGVILCKPDR